jgi:hypothetical protein
MACFFQAYTACTMMLFRRRARGSGHTQAGERLQVCLLLDSMSCILNGKRVTPGAQVTAFKNRPVR